MQRIAAAVCCILWLFYGSMSGWAHTHAAWTPETAHGLGLDHSHDSDGHDPSEHQGTHGSYSAKDSSCAHHERTIYLTANAVKPGLKLIMAPIDPAGSQYAAPPVSRGTGQPASDWQPRDPPSRDLPGLRAPPA